MINTPKDLSDIEVGLYRSGYGFCEKLVKEEHITIAVAVEKTAAKFGGLNMISDMECFKKFLFSEVTAYTEPSIGVCDLNLEDKTCGMSSNKIRNLNRSIGAVTMTIC